MNIGSPQWHSLKTRVTLFTLVIFVLSIGALSVFASRLLREDMERLLGEEQFSTVSFIARQIGEEMGDRFDAMGLVAKDAGLDLMGSPSALQARLEQRPILQKLFNAGTLIVGADGTTLASVPVSVGRIGVNYMDRDHIAAALKEGKPAIGRPVIGRQFQAPIFGMAVPIRNAQGKVIGALAGVIDLSKPNFLDKITQNNYGRTGGFLVIAPKYREIVTATDKKRIMEVLPGAGVNRYVDRNIAGGEGYSVLVDALGQEQLASVKQIPEVGWYVLLGTPAPEAFAPIHNMQQRVLLVTLFLTLLAAGLTWRMLRRALSPLIATAGAMVALSNANRIPKPLPVTSQDEIGQLTGGFNRLIETWTQREDALKKSEQNLAITLNSIADAVITTDQAAHIIGMNPAAEHLSGRSLADATGRPLAEVFHMIHAETRKTVPDPVQLVMAHGQVVSLPDHTVLVTKDAQQHQITDSAAPVHNAAGDIVGVVLVLSDVTEKYRVQAALQTSEQDYRSLLENLACGVVVHRPDTSIMLSNSMAATLLGLTQDQMMGKPAPDPNWCFLREDGTPMLLKDYPVNRVIAAGERLRNHVVGVRHADCHEPTWVLCNAYPMHDADGNLLKVVVTFADITERQQSEQALRIAAIAFEAQQGIAITNSHRVILRVNQAFTTVTGFSAEEAVGQNTRIMKSGRHNSDFYTAMSQALESEGTWAGEIWNRRKNGELYPAWLSIGAVKDGAGLTTHYVAIFNDVTERVNALAQIDTLAFYDPLTLLPNRRLLLDRLDQALLGSTRRAGNNALLFVDLDNFKILNDTLGHGQGDMLLVQVAQRLKTCVREGDTVARLGSDEFLVMLENLSEDDIEAATEAETVGKSVLEGFKQAFSLELGPHHSTPSIGITLFGGQTLESNEQPLKRAELAMFQAKEHGRNTLRFFDHKMEAAVNARVSMEAGLRDAIGKDQFLLHYQAQVTGKGWIKGVEALLRWQNPKRGMVSPAEFIPLAEETGLILPIGRWVLETACKQLVQWTDQPLMAHLTIAVNVSAKQFHQSDFVDQVLSTLALSGANPTRLKLELTESMLVDNVEDLIVKMNTLKARGVGFSLDDFGTGYSSLSYLKRLPLDQLKIDQGFVRDILIDANDAAIAKMVVALADTLGLSVMAEGVETEAQRLLLATLGCHSYQGYLFSRPLPIQEFEEFAATVLPALNS